MLSCWVVDNFEHITWVYIVLHKSMILMKISEDPSICIYSCIISNQYLIIHVFYSFCAEMRCTFQIQISTSHSLISPSPHVNNRIIAILISSAVITASAQLHVLIASAFLWLRNDHSICHRLSNAVFMKKEVYVMWIFHHFLSFDDTSLRGELISLEVPLMFLI